MKKIFLLIFSALFTSLLCFAQTNPTSSQELYGKFKAISDKICQEIMVEQNEIAKENGQELSEDQLKAITEKASSELLEKHKSAFATSDVEAKKLLTGEFDDLKNEQEIIDCVKEFISLAVELPLPFQYLIEQSNSKKLQGLELEFAARLFKEYLKQNR